MRIRRIHAHKRLLLILAALAVNSCGGAPEKTTEVSVGDSSGKSDKEWQTCLTPEQYRVLRQKGTEAAFTGKYYNHHEDGIYRCAACGNELFRSDEKFESGTGWPSYAAPIRPDAVRRIEDNSHGMRRTEVVCGRCGSHLGHVFDDGPAPTGQRFCINSVSLDFSKKQKDTP